MKISFVIAAFNIDAYIQACLDSVFRASHAEDEIIVVNDGSTDQTLHIIESFQEDHPNLRIINKKNGGLSSARNAGLAAASGDYILFLDGDDVLIPDHFDAIRLPLSKDQPDILITDHLNWMDDGRGPLIPSIPRSHSPLLAGVDRKKNLRETLDDCIPCVWTRLIHKSIFQGMPANPFMESLIYDDLPITPHLTALASSLLYVPLPLVQYRSRSNSLTKLRTHRSCTDMVQAAVQATKAIERLPSDQDLIISADMMLARKTMEAIRQCREAESPSYALHFRIVQICINSMRSNPRVISNTLRATGNIRDIRIARHLITFARFPRIYSVVQSLLAYFKKK